MTDIRHLHVSITVLTDGADDLVVHVDKQIPPTYTARDLAALTARTVEDAAFTLNRQAFGRSPTHGALLALAARLKALEAIKDALPAGTVKDQIEAIFDLTNDEATAQYGDDPDGP